MRPPNYASEESLTQRMRRQRQDCERLIRWYFPPSEHSIAANVAWRASAMNPLACYLNESKGIGLFAIVPGDVGIAPEDAWRLHNPIVNVAAAHKLWCARGWSAWPGEHSVEEPPPFQDKKEE